jgi:hypothetical protein
MTELSRRNALGSIALGIATAAAPMEGMAQSVPALRLPVDINQNHWGLIRRNWRVCRKG